MGTFLADLLVMLVPAAALFLSWFCTDMDEFYSHKGGVGIVVVLLFTLQLVAFSHVLSFLFKSAKSCITVSPMIIIVSC